MSIQELFVSQMTVNYSCNFQSVFLSAAIKLAIIFNNIKLETFYMMK